MQEQEEWINDLDPLTCYIIVRRELNMSIGKACAQVGHATQLLTIKYFDLRKEARNLQKILVQPHLATDEIRKNNEAISKKIVIMNDWMASGYRKVVLGADDKEFEKIKLEYKADMVLIVDAGLTELISGSETVICLPPILKSKCSNTLKRLQVLK